MRTEGLCRIFWFGRPAQRNSPCHALMTSTSHIPFDIDPSWTEETDLIFVGTGSSGGTPKLTCLTKKPFPVCKTCVDATEPDNPNNRRNTSALIRTRWYSKNASSERVLVKDRFILIDCGKSFMQSAIAQFPKHGVPRIDAVLLTHSHADACFGMDDLRALSATLPKGQGLPVYLREVDLEIMRGPFGYLMPTAQHTRFVASLNFIVFPPSEPLNILGLTLIPLEVEHGPGYTSLGYAFGNTVYISDMNRIYEHTRTLLSERFKFGSLPLNASEEEKEKHQKDRRRPMDLLIIDALFPEEPYPSHLSLLQAVDEAKIYRPLRTLTVGMAHQCHHHEHNEELKKYLESDNLSIELAFDGQLLPIKL